MSAHVVRFAGITYTGPDGRKEHAYAGDTVQLNDEEAAQLVAQGAVHPADEAPS